MIPTLLLIGLWINILLGLITWELDRIADTLEKR